MPTKEILKSLKKYRKTTGTKRAAYMRSFEEKMIYRTTKTENPETTPSLVRRVLRKYKSS